jgi:hypothetical protein
MPTIVKTDRGLELITLYHPGIRAGVKALRGRWLNGAWHIAPEHYDAAAALAVRCFPDEPFRVVDRRTSKT